MKNLMRIPSLLIQNRFPPRLLALAFLIIGIYVILPAPTLQPRCTQNSHSAR